MLTSTDEPLDDACDIAHLSMKACHPFAARPSNRRCVVCPSQEDLSRLHASSLRLGRGWMLAAIHMCSKHPCGSFRGGERDGARPWGGVACID